MTLNIAKYKRPFANSNGHRVSKKTCGPRNFCTLDVDVDPQTWHLHLACDATKHKRWLWCGKPLPKKGTWPLGHRLPSRGAHSPQARSSVCSRTANTSRITSAASARCHRRTSDAGSSVSAIKRRIGDATDASYSAQHSACCGGKPIEVATEVATSTAVGFLSIRSQVAARVGAGSW